MNENGSGIVFSVSQINEYLGKKLGSDPFLSRIVVAGEVTNFSLSSIGHAFFSLKDEACMLNCIMYDFAANESRDIITDGAKIKASGRVTYYKRGGSVQLAVEFADTLGVGDLYAQFEQTKAKLEEEGLFDVQYKKPIPSFPTHIGVVTSAAGAAVHDIINVSTRRFEGVRITVYPAKVQGQGAARQVANGIRYFNENIDADVLIVGRGGGSFEDLFVFNEEMVARAVFESDIPVVSAVGHETDFSLCDMAADLRAPTPSAAAELVVADKQAVIDHVSAYKRRYADALTALAERTQARLNTISAYISSYPFELKVTQMTGNIDIMKETMISVMSRMLETAQMQVNKLKSDLINLDPRNVLRRGYAIVFDEAGGVVSAAEGAQENMTIEFVDGKVDVVKRG